MRRLLFLTDLIVVGGLLTFYLIAAVMAGAVGFVFAVILTPLFVGRVVNGLQW